MFSGHHGADFWSWIFRSLDSQNWGDGIFKWWNFRNLGADFDGSFQVTLALIFYYEFDFIVFWVDSLTSPSDTGSGLRLLPQPHLTLLSLAWNFVWVSYKSGEIIGGTCFFSKKGMAELFSFFPLLQKPICDLLVRAPLFIVRYRGFSFLFWRLVYRPPFLGCEKFFS